MRKFLFSLLALSLSALLHAEGITTNPSPAVSTKPLEVTISCSDLGSEVYLYSWCLFSDDTKKSPWGWTDVHTPKFKMSGSNGTYTIKINNLQDFYDLTDVELEKLKKLGMIAKNVGGGQSGDLFVEVEQGRRDAYSGGEGTSASPFILKTPADLQTLASTPMDWVSDCYLRMEADIDASGLTSPIGTRSTPFIGNFDGNGHSVTGLDLTESKIGTATGLFGAINGGTVRNLGVVKGRVTGTTFVGLLVGCLESGTVERCFTTGTVKGSSICVGGLAGENVAGTILDCYSGAEVTNTDDYATGGLVGKNSGTITNTYAGGEVNGHDYAGGLVGANYGTVNHSAALNKTITAPHDFVARFGGNNNPENLGRGNLSWEEMAAGRGTWGMHGDHANATAANDLKDKTNFETMTGWDFDNIWEWKTDMNKEYPALRNLENQRTPLSEEYYISSTGVSATELNEGGLTAGPNPTSGPVELRCAAGLQDYAVTGLGGRQIVSGTCGGTQEVTIDLTGATPGLYLLRVTGTEGKISTFKIIKK